jgi:hypothetical protein
MNFFPSVGCGLSGPQKAAEIAPVGHHGGMANERNL